MSQKKQILLSLLNGKVVLLTAFGSGKSIGLGLSPLIFFCLRQNWRGTYHQTWLNILHFFFFLKKTLSNTELHILFLSYSQPLSEEKKKITLETGSLPWLASNSDFLQCQDRKHVPPPQLREIFLFVTWRQSLLVEDLPSMTRS